MTQVGNRHVFIFNGLEGGPSAKHAIEYMDLGMCEPSSFKKARWVPVEHQNTEFHVNEPRASAQLGPNEIIVFGGQGSFTYLVDIAQLLASRSVGSSMGGGASARVTRLKYVDQKTGEASDARLLRESQFCQGTDFTIKTFGNFMYAVDTVKKELHVCSVKERQWNFSTLADLGINH
jgi:hypothetical protein